MHDRLRLAVVLTAMLGLVGGCPDCDGDEPEGEDGSTTDAAVGMDASSGSSSSSGATSQDAGVGDASRADATPVLNPDASSVDAAPQDASVPDAQSRDAGANQVDGAVVDAAVEAKDAAVEAKDAAVVDAAVVDAAVVDAAVVDAAVVDAAVVEPASDASVAADASEEAQDASVADAGIPDPQKAWHVVEVDVQQHFMLRPVVALAPDGNVRMVYNITTDSSNIKGLAILYAEETDTGFVKRTVVDSPDQILNNELPVMVVDGSGTSHVFYNRADSLTSKDIDIYMVSGDKDGFSEPVNLTQTVGIGETAVHAALDANHDIHLVFLRRIERTGPGQENNYDYTMGYLKIENGQPSPVEVIADPAQSWHGEPEQAITVDAQGRPHVLFHVPCSDPSRSQLIYRRRADGMAPTSGGAEKWNEAFPITLDSEGVVSVGLAMDAIGNVHMSYSSDGTNRTIYYRNMIQGVLGAPIPITSSNQMNRAYYLGFAYGEDAWHVAYGRMLGGFADVYYRSGDITGPTADEVALTQTPGGDENPVALAAGPAGKVYVAFVEAISHYPQSTLYLARYE